MSSFFPWWEQPPGCAFHFLLHPWFDSTFSHIGSLMRPKIATFHMWICIFRMIREDYYLLTTLSTTQQIESLLTYEWEIPCTPPALLSTQHRGGMGHVRHHCWSSVTYVVFRVCNMSSKTFHCFGHFQKGTTSLFSPQTHCFLDFTQDKNQLCNFSPSGWWITVVRWRRCCFPLSHFSFDVGLWRFLPVILTMMSLSPIISRTNQPQFSVVSVNIGTNAGEQTVLCVREFYSAV